MLQSYCPADDVARTRVSKKTISRFPMSRSRRLWPAHIVPCRRAPSQLTDWHYHKSIQTNGVYVPISSQQRRLSTEVDGTKAFVEGLSLDDGMVEGGSSFADFQFCPNDVLMGSSALHAQKKWLNLTAYSQSECWPVAVAPESSCSSFVGTSKRYGDVSRSQRCIGST